MELTIIVSDETQSALEQRAQARGYRDVSTYVERLISTDLLAAKSFDDILAPIRQTFQGSGMADDKLAALFEEAREDEKYLNLAVAVQAAYLVSRDKDLLDLMTGHSDEGKDFRRRFRPLKIIEPVEFLKTVMPEETSAPKE